MPSKSKTSKLPDLLSNLKYINKVQSKRTVYYVFQSEKDYLLFSYSNSTYRAGNFNVVMADMVERIKSIFVGKPRITRKMVEEHPQMKKFAKDFDVLQALYVLVATGQASIDKRSPNVLRLYFNIYK
jgi:hypothetical protein